MDKTSIQEISAAEAQIPIEIGEEVTVDNQHDLVEMSDRARAMALNMYLSTFAREAPVMISAIPADFVAQGQGEDIQEEEVHVGRATHRNRGVQQKKGDFQAERWRSLVKALRVWELVGERIPFESRELVADDSASLRDFVSFPQFNGLRAQHRADESAWAQRPIRESHSTVLLRAGLDDRLDERVALLSAASGSQGAVALLGSLGVETYPEELPSCPVVMGWMGMGMPMGELSNKVGQLASYRYDLISFLIGDFIELVGLLVPIVAPLPGERVVQHAIRTHSGGWGTWMALAAMHLLFGVRSGPSRAHKVVLERGTGWIVRAAIDAAFIVCDSVRQRIGNPSLEDGRGVLALVGDYFGVVGLTKVRFCSIVANFFTTGTLYVTEDRKTTYAWLFGVGRAVCPKAVVSGVFAEAPIPDEGSFASTMPQASSHGPFIRQVLPMSDQDLSEARRLINVLREDLIADCAIQNSLADWMPFVVVYTMSPVRRARRVVHFFRSRAKNHTEDIFQMSAQLEPEATVTMHADQTYGDGPFFHVFTGETLRSVKVVDHMERASFEYEYPIMAMDTAMDRKPAHLISSVEGVIMAVFHRQCKATIEYAPGTVPTPDEVDFVETVIRSARRAAIVDARSVLQNVKVFVWRDERKRAGIISSSAHYTSLRGYAFLPLTEENTRLPNANPQVVAMTQSVADAAGFRASAHPVRSVPRLGSPLDLVEGLSLFEAQPESSQGRRVLRGPNRHGRKYYPEVTAHASTSIGTPEAVYGTMSFEDQGGVAHGPMFGNLPTALMSTMIVRSASMVQFTPMLVRTTVVHRCYREGCEARTSVQALTQQDKLKLLDPTLKQDGLVALAWAPGELLLVVVYDEIYVPKSRAATKKFFAQEQNWQPVVTWSSTGFPVKKVTLNTPSWWRGILRYTSGLINLAVHSQGPVHRMGASMEAQTKIYRPHWNYGLQYWYPRLITSPSRRFFLGVRPSSEERGRDPRTVYAAGPHITQIWAECHPLLVFAVNRGRPCAVALGDATTGQRLTRVAETRLARRGFVRTLDNPSLTSLGLEHLMGAPGMVAMPTELTRRVTNFLEQQETAISWEAMEKAQCVALASLASKSSVPQSGVTFAAVMDGVTPADW